MASGIGVTSVEQVGDSEEVRRKGEARFQAGPSNWGQDDTMGANHLEGETDTHGGKSQTANPLGFRAWKSFLSKVRSEGAPDPKAACESGNGSRGGTGRQEVEDWSSGISWSIIAQEMEGMEVSADLEEGVEGNIRVIELDMANAATKIGRLRKTAVLLQALESSPSRDRVVSWVRETMVIQRNVGISQVVRFFEWAEKDLVKQSAHLCAAWVELKGVPPFLEDQAITMLKALGPVVQHTVDKQGEQRYANIRGCILIDTSLELPKYVGIKTPWGKMYLQPVTQTWPTRAPEGQQHGVPPPGGFNVAASPEVGDADGFVEVSSRRSPKERSQDGNTRREKMAVSNRFSALGEAEVEGVAMDHVGASASAEAEEELSATPGQSNLPTSWEMRLRDAEMKEGGEKVQKATNEGHLEALVQLKELASTEIGVMEKATAVDFQNNGVKQLETNEVVNEAGVNPFPSIVSILEESDKRVKMGKEVVFACHWGGRGPKKKGVGARSQTSNDPS
ncbi:hypothetical protein R1sor_008579 [Riccia sorocarpa]|uniref:DUF4283 domain-containing protein n=1 Tax=Riccia sorocarpa TaxID=122646 RepID=A0ABD3HU86_9MARC